MVRVDNFIVKRNNCIIPNCDKHGAVRISPNPDQPKLKVAFCIKHARIVSEQTEKALNRIKATAKERQMKLKNRKDTKTEPEMTTFTVAEMSSYDKFQPKANPKELAANIVANAMMDFQAIDALLTVRHTKISTTPLYAATTS